MKNDDPVERAYDKALSNIKSKMIKEKAKGKKVEKPKRAKKGASKRDLEKSMSEDLVSVRIKMTRKMYNDFKDTWEFLLGTEEDIGEDLEAFISRVLIEDLRFLFIVKPERKDEETISLPS